jgi:hypothetical protein
MRKLGVFVLALPLWGVVDKATVYNASGSTQSSFPVPLVRFLAPGELVSPNVCMAPYKAGVKVTKWQCDVINSWRAPAVGVQQVIVTYWTQASLANEASETIELRPDTAFSSTGGVSLTKAETLARPWDFEIDIVFNRTNASDHFTVTRNLRTMMTGLAEGPGLLRKWRNGPHVVDWIIEDRTTASSLDLGGQWIASGAGCVSGLPCWLPAPNVSPFMYKSIHPIGYLSIYSGTTNYAKGTIILENVWTKRKQNQKVSLTFKAGSPMTVRETKNDYNFIYASRLPFEAFGTSSVIPGHVVDPYFPYLIYSGALPVYETESPTGEGFASLIGLQGEIDHYDYALNGDDPRYCTVVSNRCRQTGACCAQWTKVLDGPGGWGDIGPEARWFSRWFYIVQEAGITAAKKLEYFTKAVIGNANAALNMPRHFRESRSALPFCGNMPGILPEQCADTTTNEFGRIVSPDAHPTEATLSGTTLFATNVTGISGEANATLNGWSVTSDGAFAHSYSTCFVPYLLTGDWWRMEECQMVAAWAYSGVNPADTHLNTRNGRFTLFTKGGGSAIRRAAWMFREVANGYAVSPEGVERQFMEKVILNNVERMEGENAITAARGGLRANPSPNCTFPCRASTDPADFTIWQWARDLAQINQVGGTDRLCRAENECDNPLLLAASYNTGGVNLSMCCIDPTLTAGISSGWMDGYWVHGLYAAYRLGFPEVKTIMLSGARPQIVVANDQVNFNPFVIGSYQQPIGKQAFTRKLVDSCTKITSTQIECTVPDHGYVAADKIVIGGTATTNSWSNAYCRELVPSTITTDTFRITCSSFSSILSGDAFPADLYVNKTAFGGWFQTWADWFNAFGQESKTNDGFTVVPQDSVYSQIWRGALGIAAELDYSFDGYSGKKAYEWLKRNNQKQDSLFNRGSCLLVNKSDISACENNIFAISKRPEITNVQVTARTSSGFTVKAMMPTGHAAKLGVTTGTSFPSTDTSSDFICTMKGFVATCSATSLAANTLYRFRLVGGALSGTARYPRWMSDALPEVTTLP